MAGDKQRYHFRRWEWAGLVLVCLLAAFLRLGKPGVVEFKRDEANLSRLALDFVSGEKFPFLGIGSSVGFPNAPINVYLFGIPYAISNNPLIATLFVGFLNILAVALLWKMTRRYFGSDAALIAGLFYAVSPWAAIYSRKIWAQDVLPPFVIATVFSGILGFVEAKPKRWAQLIHLTLLALTVQIHLGAVTLIPITLLMVGMGWRKWRREFWISIGIAVLLCLPYLYGLYDADLLSISAIRNSLNQSADESPSELRQLSTTTLDYAWFVVAGTNIHSLTGEQQFQRYLDSVPPVYTLFKLIPLAVIFSAAGMALWAYRKRSLLLMIFVVWLVLPVLIFSYTWAAPQPHYVIPMMPAAFVILGVGIANAGRFLAQKNRLFVPILGIGLATIVILQIWLFVALLNFLDKHDTSGAFGTPLHYLLDVRQDLLSEKTERVIFTSEGSSPLYDNDPAVWDVLLDDVQVEYVAASYLWIVPEKPTALLVSPAIGDDDAWLTRVGSVPDKAFALRPGEGHYRLWKSVPFDLPENSPEVEAHFANGVTLTQVWRENDALWLVWRVPENQNGVQYIVFIHALDAQESRIRQVDLPFWAESNWKAGDSVIFKTDLSLEGAQSLRIGMYTLVGSTNFRTSELLDAEGRYLDQWFSLELDDIPVID